MLDLFLIAGGIALLLFGGELIVRGASNLAKAFGISPLVIGLTVVAFGTSVPELAVNVAAAINGRGQLCFGNVMGSNIANIGLILGCSAILAPLVVRKPIVIRDLPILLLSVLAAAVLGLDHFLDGAPDVYTRSDAIVLLLIFGVFLYSTAYIVLKDRERSSQLQLEAGTDEEAPPPWWPNALIALIGLALLVVGGGLTVRGATELARLVGLSEVVIGLTVVSIGTSLPELVTSIVATRRGETDLAVGNVVGSNIFNLLLVMGISATIQPTALPAGGFADLLILGLLSFCLLPLAITGWKLDRLEGAVLLLAYLSYITWRVWDGVGQG